jgi:hypothetical protein
MTPELEQTILEFIKYVEFVLSIILVGVWFLVGYKLYTVISGD